MSDHSVIWAPQAGSQQRFLSCPFREVLYEGTRGPGKTDALLMSYGQFIGQGFGPAWRGIIFRETYKQLKDVVAKSQKWFNQIFPGARFNASDYQWNFPDGEALIFSYMRTAEDYWNYHGHEYPWIGWEELTNWPNQGPYDAMRSCNRSSHGDDRMPRWIRSTCNPWGVGHHWVKSKFIDQAPAEKPITETVKDPVTGESLVLTRCYIHGDWRENKILLKADPEYIVNLQQESDPNKRKAWLDGDWNIAAGGIFGAFWRKEIHAIEPFKIPIGWRIERSFDWGSSKPFSVGWWAISDGNPVTQADGSLKKFPKGTHIRINEWYGCKEGSNVPPNQGLEMLSEDIALGILKREQAMLDGGMIKRKPSPGPADSSIFDRADGHSIADGMSKKGVRWIEADKSPGSRVQGWERIRNLLKAAVDEDDHGSIIPRTTPMEDPGLFVFNTCRHWIRTVPVLPRDSDKPDDVDTDAEDHAGDETRYEVFRKKKTGSQQEIML